MTKHFSANDTRLSIPAGNISVCQVALPPRAKARGAGTPMVRRATSRPKPQKLVTPVEHWPAQDRDKWNAATHSATGLRKQRYADVLTPRSIEAAWKSYGRLIHILVQNAALDLSIGPAERITHDAVALYFDELRAAGNCDNTIKGRMFHLRTALHIMAPRQNFDWITRPDGVSLDSILKQVPNDDLFVPPSVRVYQWGVRLMAAEPLPDHPAARLQACRDYRNGLIIALLACRAPRLASLAAMRLDTNLYKRNGEYWVRLQSMIVKNRRELHYSLPPDLSPYIDRYLFEIRPILLDPARTDAVWGSGDGQAFRYRSIQTMLFRQSEAAFGEKFGAHRFRHSFASSLAQADPSNPGLAAVILGISEAVINEHYRKARQTDAALKFQVDLWEERRRTKRAAP